MVEARPVVVAVAVEVQGLLEPLQQAQVLEAMAEMAFHRQLQGQASPVQEAAQEGLQVVEAPLDQVVVELRAIPVVQTERPILAAAAARRLV